MKLRNKQTGEIYELNEFCLYDDKGFAKRPFLKSLAELNSEWEDYEEPKGFWSISGDATIEHYDRLSENDHCKEIGNYFETKEEAEKAVEKLKAWKRLKDKRFKFHEWYKPDGCEPFIVIETNIDYDDVDNMGMQKDLDLLFGGEE